MKKLFVATIVFFLALATPIACAAEEASLTWERSQMHQVEIETSISAEIASLDLIGQGETIQFSPAGKKSNSRDLFQVLIPSSFELGEYSVRGVLQDGSYKNFANVRIVEYQSEGYSPLTDTATVATLSVTLFSLLAAWGLRDDPARREDDEYEDDQSTFDGADGGEIGRGAQDARNHRRGLISSIELDQWRSVATITTNRVSPLLSRLIADGSYLQFSLGSLVLALPVIGGLLGGLAFQDIQGIGSITTPSLTISLAIILLATFDAAAGFIAATVFGLCAYTSGAFGNVYDIRTFLGMAVLWFSPALIANATRSMRRSRRDSNTWERATDVIVGSLITGWVVHSLVLALNGLAHLRLPLEQHANSIGIAVGAAIAVRYLLEGYVNKKNHYYLAYLSPRTLNNQGSYFRLGNWFTKAFFFLFFATSFLGMTWQIWAGLFIIIFPSVTKVVKEKFPNVPTLFQLIPVGIPSLVVMTIFGRAYYEYLNGLALNPATASRTIFILAALPGFILGILRLFGREPKPGEVRWYMRPQLTALYRVGGVAMFATYIALTVGFVG
jgi:hypothetical protein